MAAQILQAPRYLGFRVREAALAECCQAQRVALSRREAERRLMEDAGAIMGASMRLPKGCIGCITANIDSWVASVAAFAADNCSQSSSLQGPRGSQDASRSSSCKT